MVSEVVDFFMGPLRRVDIERLVADVIDDQSETIQDLNRAQLARGETAGGGQITPFYKPITVRIKRRKGQPTDRVTLKDTGSFYGGFYTKRVPGGTEVTSTDGKTAELVETYSVDIFGLSVASREELADRLRPLLQDRYNDAIR